MKINSITFKNLQSSWSNVSMSIKKIIVLLFIVLFSSECIAQNLNFLGLPMQSTISEFSQALTSHRFHYDNTYKFWRYGDFWKIKNCDVHLFAMDNIHVELIDVDFYPTSNQNSWEDYTKAVKDLISDLSDKYGTPHSIDTLREDDVHYCSVSTTFAKNDLFYILEWNIHEDKLLLVFNNSRGYIIQMRYISKERIRRINESLKFKGKGTADL